MTLRDSPATIAALTLFLALGYVRAQTPAAPATPPPAAAQPAKAPASEFDEFIKQLKKPASWLTLGGDFRLRNEYYNNIVTLSQTVALHEQDLFRYRWRISGAATLAPNLTFNARLAGEARSWVKPAFVGAFKAQTGMEWRFAGLDTFNLKWINASPTPLTLTVGRQDIMLGDAGDWWLVMDGTPNDGSWTVFFDAARLTVDAKSIQTKFDIIALEAPVKADAWLPTIGHSTQFPLTDQRERGLILYASNKSVKNTQIDGYFIYKNDKRQTVTVAGATRVSGDNADIGTLGAKISGAPTANWQYSLEGAYQFGSKYDRISGVFARRDLKAYGGKGKLTYLFKDARNNQLTFSGEILSGDDSTTAGTDEMFDILWGRWPRWSELYIYSYIYEAGGRVAQMNNLGHLGVGWSSTPVKSTTFSLTYRALFALEETPTRAVTPAVFSRSGNFRGHYVQAFVKHQFSKYVSGHLWAEWIKQGDYYARRDTLTFLRAELAFAF